MKRTLLALAVSGLMLGACAQTAEHDQAPAASVEVNKVEASNAPAGASPSAAQTNPLLAKSSLPFEYPPFDRIRDDDFMPAFEAGMAEQDREIQAIAHDPAPPTFDNTIVAMERSGQLLERVQRVFLNLNQSNTDEQLQKIDEESAPKLAAHEDAINLDPVLFGRIDALYRQRANLGLDPVSAQLLDRYYQRFVRAGARLSDADKMRLKQINQRLSMLNTQFEQNVLKATQDGAVTVDSVSDLDGLPPEEIGAAAEAAKARKLDGKWLITLQNTTIQPVLASLKNRELRKRIYLASIGRAQGGKADNTAVVAETLKLRAEQAALLGYPDHAAYQLEDETAGTPARVNKMLAELAPAALAQAHREAADIQHLIDAQAKTAHTRPFKLEPWDWAFYAEQVRKARFDFDEAQVKPYFELDRVLKDGVFYVANQLYGITFKERTDLPVYQKDVRVFEVFDADGSPLGLFIADYFKRDNKQGGAWMDNYVAQSGLFDRKAVVVNNLNIAKPPEGQPVLLTFDEVTTMFHEFGHGLHGLFSNVKYPFIAGTDVPPDFVEYPSQFNEMWAREPSVLAHYAHDYRTGEAMPQALFDKVLAATKFGAGYEALEYIEAAMLDQSLHQVTASQVPSAAQVMAFEAAALKKDGVDYGPVPPRYHTPYFSHAFSGGYSAGYYAYIWSEVLARDTGHWFHTHGGISRANGDYFRAKILSRGRTEEPERLFEEFYGQPPEVGPLLEYRGLSLSASK